ncbi:MAG: dihydrofolate reductase [Clostridiales Family XIII bacterium]|jgi:dihydrofolate reductase|nr:dihydrofolate reductase [Clostridiales Family XIII bacterium]
MIAIFAADSEWGIGRGVRLPWRLPGDLAYFKERTMGGVVVMGRRTFESIAAVNEPVASHSCGAGEAARGSGDDAAGTTPGSGVGTVPRPLPGRTNIVLTRDAGYTVPGVTVAHSTGELLELLNALTPCAGADSPEIYGNADASEARGAGGRGVYVCGGAEVYRLLMPYTDICLATRIEASFGADTFFPIESERADGTGFVALGSDGSRRRFVFANESEPVTEIDIASGRTVTYRFREYRADRFSR